MCFVRGWSPGFFARAIAPWLSPLILVGIVCLYLSCSRSCHNQIASCAVHVQAMYSASVDESAGESWSLLLHDMAALQAKNTNPPVDWHVSRSPAQSESV